MSADKVENESLKQPSADKAVVVKKQSAAEKVVHVRSKQSAPIKPLSVFPVSAAEIVTSVRLKQSTVERLKAIGRKGESYDTIVVWLLEHSKRRTR